MELTKLTPTGKNSTVTVDDSVFGIKPSPVLLSQAVRVYLSNQRQGSAQAQTRGEVSLTKRKMYRQKGTGGARHGAQSAPIFVGGGVAHGPTGNQNWSKSLSRKQKTLALRQALSWQKDQIMVSDMLLELSNKTKHGAEFLQAVVKDKKSILLVFELSQKSVPRVFRNIPTTRLQTPERLTAYDILRADAILFTTQALQKLQERLAQTEDATSKPEVARLPLSPTKSIIAKQSAVPKTDPPAIRHTKTTVQKPVTKSILSKEKSIKKESTKTAKAK